MIKVSMEAPWHTFHKKVQALFEKDPDIYVGSIYQLEDGSDANYAFSIEVKNHEKFVALDRALPRRKTFGNVSLNIVLYDEENNDVHPGIKLFETIFKGNPIMKDMKVRTDSTGIDHVYVRFQPKVVQFFDDDISDYNGNWTGIAEDIAREVFENTWAVNFCTADLRENEETPAEILRTPLGEWP